MKLIIGMRYYIWHPGTIARRRRSGFEEKQSGVWKRNWLKVGQSIFASCTMGAHKKTPPELGGTLHDMKLTDSRLFSEDEVTVYDELAEIGWLRRIDLQ